MTSSKFLCCMAIGVLSFSLTSSVLAQTTRTPDGLAPTISDLRSQRNLPDENTLARLVWSTMVALDNANRTDNYSVLYQLGTVGFQRQNTPAKLNQSFANLRENRVDIGRAILSTPTYYQPPAILTDGTLRLRGGFDFRPNSIRFDLIYKNIGGGWRINAISVVQMDSMSPRQ